MLAGMGKILQLSQCDQLRNGVAQRRSLAGACEYG